MASKKSKKDMAVNAGLSALRAVAVGVLIFVVLVALAVTWMASHWFPHTG